jgi:hypothetical protein
MVLKLAYISSNFLAGKGTSLVLGYSKRASIAIDAYRGQRFVGLENDTEEHVVTLLPMLG